MSSPETAAGLVAALKVFSSLDSGLAFYGYSLAPGPQGPGEVPLDAL